MLSGSDVTSLQEVFGRILRTENSSIQMTSASTNSALVTQNKYGPWKPNQSGYKREMVNTEGRATNPVFCVYCKKPGHTKFECWKLQNKQKQSTGSRGSVPVNQSAHIAKTNGDDNKSVHVSADEFAKFTKYQESLKDAPTHVSTVAKSRRWVIDSSATDHMTGNALNFSKFQSNSSNHNVTLANGSSSSVKGSGTINLTNTMSLENVLHLPDLAFNLLSVSQITKELDCCVSFYPTHCIFQDRLTKQIIGKDHESGGLYSLIPLLHVQVLLKLLNYTVS